jgi:hypothetical protein
MQEAHLGEAVGTRPDSYRRRDVVLGNTFSGGQRSTWRVLSAPHAITAGVRMLDPIVMPMTTPD